MPKFIVHHEGIFFEYSTIVDAPVTCAMTRQEVRDYLVGNGDKDVEERPDRAVKRGCSSLSPVMTAEEATSLNHAGPDGNELSFEDLIKMVKEMREPLGRPPLNLDNA